jgi:hypothetical protein
VHAGFWRNPIFSASETLERMAQSDANCSPSTCQPVDTRAAVNKAAVDAPWLTSTSESRTMLLLIKEVLTGRAHLGADYLLRAPADFRRFESRQDAGLPQLWHRNEGGPPECAVAAGTTLGTLGLSRSRTRPLPEERAPCARRFRPTRCLSWTAKMRFPWTHPSPSGDSGDCRLQM